MVLTYTYTVVIASQKPGDDLSATVYIVLARKLKRFNIYKNSRALKGNPRIADFGITPFKCIPGVCSERRISDLINWKSALFECLRKKLLTYAEGSKAFCYASIIFIEYYFSLLKHFYKNILSSYSIASKSFR